MAPRKRKSVAESVVQPKKEEKFAATETGEKMVAVPANPNEGMVAVPANTRLVWQLHNTEDSWTPYSREVCDALTAAAMSCRKTIHLSAGARSPLVVDLVSMVQSAARGATKSIRCLVQGREEDEVDQLYLFEVEKEEGGWCPLVAGIAAKLNQVMDISSEVTVDGHKYDLVQMLRDGSRKIRRVKADSGKFTKSGITGRIQISAKQPHYEDEGENISPPKKAKKSGNKSGKKSGKVREEEEDSEAEDKPVMKSIIRKGLAPVDSDCPHASKYHVLCEGRTVWDCMLNQTNIQNNNNKYYLFQLLESDEGGNFSVWMRWGRVGYKGQNSWTVCGNDLARAKSIFCKKFSDKTRNEWGERESFEKYPGKYDMVLMDYSPGNTPDTVDCGPSGVKKEEAANGPPPESKLEKAVQDLISLICDIRTMEQSVVEMEYDTKKAPLGKITTDQIRAGYQALKRISDCIASGKTSGGEITQACNDFYTRIPHEFGFRVPPIIRTHEDVKKKIGLLETLSDIQVALKILSDCSDGSVHPIDRRYNQLQVDIEAMAKEDEERKCLESAIAKTHAATHSQYSMQVLDIFKLDKEAEKNKFTDVGNKKLLFHGSRLSNWAGILGQGLRIAPPEAPSTGYMFGKGVYFADMSSKSANYCFTTRSQNIGLLLICEVALGKQNKLVDADYDADKLPKGCHSVLGQGKVVPSEAKKLPSGLDIPYGTPTNVGTKSKTGYTLQYNEYIVYNTNQIKMKYLAKIKFNYK